MMLLTVRYQYFLILRDGGKYCMADQLEARSVLINIHINF